MRIGVSAEFIGTKPCGIATATRNLLRGLAPLEGPHHFYPYLATRKATSLVPSTPFIHPRLVRPYASWVRVPFTLPLELLRHPVDLFHATSGWAPPWCPRPMLATIYDLSFETHPEAFPFFMRARLSFLVRRTAHQALVVITPSQHSANDLVRLYAVPPDKIRVIHLPLDPGLAPVADPVEIGRVRSLYGLARPYILYLGTLEPKKNVDKLIRAFAALRRERDLGHQLVIAGRPLYFARPIVDLARSLGLDRDILFPGPIPEQDLAALYSGADIFAFLSAYEGFGYPPLEAMAMGTPVLASNTSSLPEILGDAAALVNPSDQEQITRRLAELLTDPGLRSDLRARGFEHVRRFDPVALARQTVAVYEECFSQILQSAADPSREVRVAAGADSASARKGRL